MNLSLVSLLMLSMLPSIPQDEFVTTIKTVMQKQVASMATVKAVIKMDMGFGGGGGRTPESRVTLPAIIVQPTGLVMVTNMPFSPKRFYEMLGSKEVTSMFGDMKATPTSIKVTLPGDDKEYDGFVAATDTNLDLLFIQIEKPPANLPVVDFSSSTQAELGQQVFMVSRLSSGYDSAPYYLTARINAEIAKPRRAYMLEGNISQFGLPVYSTGGQVLGVLTTVPPGSSDEGNSDMMGLGMMMRMLGGGGGGAGGAFVVPASTVQAVIAQAAERAKAVAADREKKKAASPTTTKPKAPSKPPKP